ncbi:MAG: Holliday junction resolvase RuvX [Pseudomonadales bacterium]|nr:Holliday junction resolvase RuvX [Pseudomonadales bacterium]
MKTYPDKRGDPVSALGFDFGTRRIGVAFGQSLTGTAEPVQTLPAVDGVPDWAALSALVDIWRPDVFVVGLPFNMDGSESELLLRARKFGQRLEGRLHRPCYGMDERLSSFAARGQRLRGESSAQVDSLAAQLILQSWFASWEKQSG